ncbi:hypothetical protein [Paraliomyxa miuraensis]|uniref:hypothetical protein n=1 Tax=Paraliomyxa miuraensis TaxID=376150 RepID=UPI00225B4AA6|nr:hypothetical protein [Paraliomyxa miuraensis]MCX4239930.1 hypothetical protein [Paraliomyxa miuraensis]
MRRAAIIVGVGLGLASGCADDEGRGGSFGVPMASASASVGSFTSGPGDGTATSSAATVADGTAEGGPGGGIKLDVAPDTGGMVDDGGNAEGCEKVDFLFVIDNSGSMGDNQDSLIASFPGFIQSIQNTLTEAQDYHIMVVDTDAQWGGACPVLCPAFGFCPEIPTYPCGVTPEACDTTLGAGVVHTMASDAPNVPCNFTTGGRYMDSTEPDLISAFQCSAKVGSDGDGSERPMGAMVGALSEDLAQPGACNEGFVREDAILVVTIITDEEDDDSNGLPAGWFANVTASKLGDATAIVMLGLINDTDAAAPVCPAESQDPAKIREFVDMFPNSIRGSVCAASYNQFFQQAVDLIDTTCDEFIPPAG